MRQTLHLLFTVAAGLSSQLAYALQDSYQNDNLGLEELMFPDHVSPTGRQLQDGESLGQYDIGPSTLYYFGTSINLDFTLNALVEEGTVGLKLYSDSDCTQEITDNDYLTPELIFDQDFVQNSTSVRPMRVQLTIIEQRIKQSPVWQERDDQFFIFFCTKVSLYTADPTSDSGAFAISTLETLSQIKVDLVGDFGVDVNVDPNNATAEEARQAYFVEGFLCDDALQKVSYARPRTQGSSLRVCVKPTDNALADGLKMRAVDSFSFYKDQSGGAQITQEALARGESANPSLTSLFCVRGTELCYFDTLLKAEFFSGAGGVTGFGEAWLQFGSGQYRRVEIRSRSLQVEQTGRVEGGFAGASAFDVDFFVIPLGEDGQSLYAAEVYECDWRNQEIISLAPRTDGPSIRICIRPNEIARALGIKINKIVSWNFTRTDLNLIQWAVEPDAIQATDGLTVLMCLPGSDVCAFRTQLMSSFFDPDGIINGVGSVWLEFASNEVTSINRRRAQEVPPNFAGASPVYLDTSVIYQEPHTAVCEYEHIFTEWWIEEDINDRYTYIGIVAGTAAALACLLLAVACCPCFGRRGVKKIEEEQDVQVNVDVKSDKKQENTSSNTQNNEESKSIVSSSGTDHTTLSTSKNEDEEMGRESSRKRRKGASALVLPTGEIQEDYTPDSDDICFGEEDHPGTKHFIRVIRGIIMEDPEAKYSPATFKSIKKGLKGRRLYKMTLKGRYRELSNDKLIELCGVAFKEQKKIYESKSSSRDLALVSSSKDNGEKGVRRSGSRKSLNEEDDSSSKKRIGRKSSKKSLHDDDDEEKGVRRSGSRKSLNEDDDSSSKKRIGRKSSKKNLHDDDDEEKRARRSSSRTSLNENDDSSSKKRIGRKSSKKNLNDDDDEEKGVRRSSSRTSLNENDHSSSKKRIGRKSSHESLREDDDEEKGVRRSGSRKGLRDDDSSSKKKGRRKSLRDDDDDKDIRRSNSRSSLRSNGASSSKKLERKNSRQSFHEEETTKETRKSSSSKRTSLNDLD